MPTIGIIGAGVVGTATGVGLAQYGHRVSFVDVDPRRIDALRTDGLDANDSPRLDEPGFVFLTLPTPNDGYRWQLDAFVAGTRALGEALRGSHTFQTVVVRSTVPPGTCDQLVVPLLEHTIGRPHGDGYSVASNPEFLRARSALEDFMHPWMTVVASHSPRTVERLAALLGPFGGEIKRLADPTTAELIKCTHNLFNAAKISFWNEMWRVCERLHVSHADVASTVARSAEGSTNVEYGIRGGEPYGGACLPKDTKGFLGFAAALGLDTPLLEAVDAVNERIEDGVDGSGNGTAARAVVEEALVAATHARPR
ncbi:MAG TPA: 2-dehydropantoate 2-reductase N-terminal domain-containing protein [Gaiellaceae bacterium]